VTEQPLTQVNAAPGPISAPSASTSFGYVPRPCGGAAAAGVNAISPDIIITPLARDEFNGRPSEGYSHLPGLSTAGRCGTSDEVATLSAPLLGPRRRIHHLATS